MNMYDHHRDGVLQNKMPKRLSIPRKILAFCPPVRALSAILAYSIHIRFTNTDSERAEQMTYRKYQQENIKKSMKCSKYYTLNLYILFIWQLKFSAK